MKLDRSSLFGRLLRRTGKFGIGLLMLVAFVAVGVLLFSITAYTAGVWFPKMTILAAFGSAYGVYLLFDRLDLKPDDREQLLVLSLDEPVQAHHREG
jgi:hypothetical protein